MKRIVAILVVMMLLVCSAFAETVELNGFLGKEIAEFANAIDGVEVFQSDDSVYAANEGFSVYASIDDDEGGTGMVDYISLEETDMGYSIFGISIGMAQADVDTLAAAQGLTAEADESDANTVRYFNDDVTVFIVVEYADGAVHEVSCL